MRGVKYIYTWIMFRYVTIWEKR